MFRTYDPSTGRYLSSDPISLAGGLNTYLYANANPVIEIDPVGLAPKGINKGRKERIETIADLFDSALCTWWPAKCLFECVRWRCSREDECGRITFHFIGGGEPFVAAPGYDPNDDEDCNCVKNKLNPG